MQNKPTIYDKSSCLFTYHPFTHLFIQQCLVKACFIGYSFGLLLLYNKLSPNLVA